MCSTAGALLDKGYSPLHAPHARENRYSPNGCYQEITELSFSPEIFWLALDQNVSLLHKSWRRSPVHRSRVSGNSVENRVQTHTPILELAKVVWALPTDWQQITQSMRVLEGVWDACGIRTQERIMFHEVDQESDRPQRWRPHLCPGAKTRPSRGGALGALSLRFRKSTQFARQGHTTLSISLIGSTN